MTLFSAKLDNLRSHQPPGPGSYSKPSAVGPKRRRSGLSSLFQTDCSADRRLAHALRAARGIVGDGALRTSGLPGSLTGSVKPDPKAQQNGATRYEGHNSAGKEIHVAWQIHEQQITQVRHAADQGGDPYCCSVRRPNEKCADDGSQTKPSQIPAMLVENSADRLVIVVDK